MRGFAMTGLGVVLATAAGCGESNAQSSQNVQRQYRVGQFDQVSVAGPYDVQVRTGGAPSVVATGPKALIDRLVVEVRDGKLLIHPRRERNLRWDVSWGIARVQVTGPMLRGAAVAGSGDLRIDRIAGNGFAASVAGSGDLQVGSVQVQSLQMSIAGSGDLRANAGRARDVKYSIAGSGDIDARNVRAETAAVSVAGSGNVLGHAARSAQVSVVGSGDVRLTGGARCSVSKRGSGRVNCS